MKKFGITLADVNKKSKEQSKKKTYMGWHQAFGGGEAPINNSIFNMGTGPTVSADGGIGMVSSVGEDLEMDYEELAKREDLDEKDVFIKKQFDNSFMPKHKKDCVKKPQTKEDEYDDDFTLKGMFEDLDSDDPEIKVTEYECRKPRFYEDISEDDDFDSDDRYEFLKRKEVYDSDGFTTDYVLYYDRKSGKYFTMFGDMDLYEPDIEYADADFGSYEEAKEWFDSYSGFEDEDEYNFDIDECVHKERVLPSHVKKETNPYKTTLIKESYTDKISLCSWLSADAVDLCESFFKFNPSTRKFKISPEEREELILDFLGGAREEAHQAGFSDEEEKLLVNELTNYFNTYKPKVGQPAVFYGSLFKLDRTKSLIETNYISKLNKQESFKYDDIPLNETAISDLAYDVQFEDGYVDKLKRNIADLEKELDFLKNTAPKEIRRGGAFDSQEEIDDAVKATERELDLQRAKYNIIKRSQK